MTKTFLFLKRFTKVVKVVKSTQKNSTTIEIKLSILWRILVWPKITSEYLLNMQSNLETKMETSPLKKGKKSTLFIDQFELLLKEYKISNQCSPKRWVLEDQLKGINKETMLFRMYTTKKSQEGRPWEKDSNLRTARKKSMQRVQITLDLEVINSILFSTSCLA